MSKSKLLRYIFDAARERGRPIPFRIMLEIARRHHRNQVIMMHCWWYLTGEHPFRQQIVTLAGT